MNQADQVQQLHAKLQIDLQHVYRQAVDIDHKLDALEEQGKGKFESVFAEDSPFKAKAKRLLPYIEELAADLQLLTEEAQLETALQTYLAKLKFVHELINEFKQI